MIKTFRDTLAQIVPPWLRKGTAARVLYAIGLQIDAMADAAVAAVKLRFPGLYSNESLPLIGRERRVRRGRLEPEASYAARLRRWLDDHRVRGNPYALLAQLWNHYQPSSFRIDLFYYPSALLDGLARHFFVDAEGVILRGAQPWTPDLNAALWARWWLIYDWPTPISRHLYGDGSKYGDGGVYGSGLTTLEVADARTVPQDWNAGHALGTVVLRGPGTTLYGDGSKYGDGSVYGAPGGSARIYVR